MYPKQNGVYNIGEILFQNSVIQLRWCIFRMIKDSNDAPKPLKKCVDFAFYVHYPTICIYVIRSEIHVSGRDRNNGAATM